MSMIGIGKLLMLHIKDHKHLNIDKIQEVKSYSHCEQEQQHQVPELVKVSIDHTWNINIKEYKKIY